ncbi:MULTISPECIES: hypothetical protein [unclassified Streptomyces]|uniref:hypothetical protein n=1 Tax=unclassified Streptomyces TaxID=2593676 RepID=UPI002366CA59|nr:MULTISPECIES: hypothetical protein [unclassified Streptomyces]MDF3142138.1 hypothetical protein [Streptomyces sp. T21Q-yed]WDF43581.1 hypothetical protein PBV52_45795 [Streptomyces sp. T12]
MDPAVIAAIVTSPTALIAAAAAYAAGRHQARGAHRGPVDAVRRQHQRDAYAAFLEAANTYAFENQATRSLRQAREEIPERGDRRLHRDRVAQRVRELRSQAADAVDPLRRALPVVQLEGPEHIAELAQEVFSAVIMVRFAAHARNHGDSDEIANANSTRSFGEEYQRLTDAITAYTTAARDYLNTGSS